MNIGVLAGQDQLETFPARGKMMQKTMLSFLQCHSIKLLPYTVSRKKLKESSPLRICNAYLNLDLPRAFFPS